MRDSYGNASSFHEMGMRSEKILRDATDMIMESLEAKSGKVYFTSGGTESNNLAILGAINVKSVKNLVTSSVEHASVYNCIKLLRNKGVNVRYLTPSRGFEISRDDLENNVSENTDFISFMHVNNEVGMVMPLDEISEVRRMRCPGAIFHVDAVQSFKKISINVEKNGIDLLSASSHKIHGPKGLGILYVSDRVNLNPLLFGGGQQGRIRPGTEPIELIAGMSEAIRCCNSEERFSYIYNLNSYCRKKLEELDNIVINSPENGSPYILNFSVLGMKSEILLNFLSENNGICVSSSSACTGNSRSHVLTAVNLSDEVVDSAIRVSFSIFNSENDVDLLIECIKKAKKMLIN